MRLLLQGMDCLAFNLSGVPDIAMVTRHRVDHVLHYLSIPHIAFYSFCNRFSMCDECLIRAGCRLNLSYA